MSISPIPPRIKRPPRTWLGRLLHRHDFSSTGEIVEVCGDHYLIFNCVCGERIAKTKHFYLVSTGGLVGIGTEIIQSMKVIVPPDKGYFKNE